jgi:hypothetical protein
MSSGFHDITIALFSKAGVTTPVTPEIRKKPVFKREMQKIC